MVDDLTAVPCALDGLDRGPTAADVHGNDLPDCPYRFPIGESDLYFCRHSHVHTADQLVDGGICRNCQQRTRRCLLPRLAPALPYQRPQQRTEPGTWEYVSLERLVADVREFVGRIPHDLTAVAGVPRSGMLPATQIATVLHLPLFSLCFERGLVDVGHGSRLEQTDLNGGRLLVVDDSVYGGETLFRVRQALRAHHPEVRPLFAAIYPRPDAVGVLDLFARPIGHPHLFEWNFLNCYQSQQFAFDVDGIFCQEWSGGDEEGGEYLNFLRTAGPRWLPRYGTVPLIVTARLEKHRFATEEWLRRHHVRFGRLVMGPWRSTAERSENFDPRGFKGRAYADSDCNLFIESDVRQAQAIFEYARKPVLCPAAGRIFQ